MAPGEVDPEISGLAVHSADVAPGNLFAALKGGNADGADNLKEAFAILDKAQSFLKFRYSANSGIK